MQIFALDERGIRYSATSAHRKINYFCLECGKSLRLRGGNQRQLHFYHLDPSPYCRQSGKSLEHLHAQLWIQKNLFQESTGLEHHFPHISRIADVVWFEKKIVFEIQCSSITAEEIKARNASYASIGYQVIWIFHDKRFNRFRLTAAENVLKHLPHYYTNIDETGAGTIYDQYSFDRNSRRLKRSSPFPIQLLPLSSVQIPKLLRKFLGERLNWNVSFQGDLLSSLSSPHIQEMIQNIHKTEALPAKKKWFSFFVSLHRGILNYFLEKTCV